jgi:UDP-N-acetylmuramoylalanine--D-glutamate ligase
VDGVRFVNDSQGTQPDAVAAALRAFDPPIVLIAGGRDKGVDLGELPDIVAERAAAAIVIGESGPALGQRFAAAGLRRVESAASLDDAVELADAIARAIRRDDETATVLLSPAAASFDMFVDYADRGRAFKAAVARLEATSRGASG